MAQSTKIQAACLLLLLVASLASSTLLQQLARQPEALQPWHRTEGRTDRPLLTPKRMRRDSHFPLCTFCCNCCGNLACGICCKT
ncbi:hepcidin [Phodopus roborovskii]|uniref:Hamp protein n=1 Tax=Phodopus roborovskii TaxID=109678 RepID=A0AAV0AA28_PHORO|nr:hepcidin [Phodopus roborovskii]CAH7362586.1 Hamp [Phodopus roborovskii]